MQRVIRFVLSTRNLAGFGAVGSVVALHLASIVMDHWVLLGGLAYLGAYFSVNHREPGRLAKASTLPEQIAWLRSQVLPKLPREAAAVLSDIIEIGEELAPQIRQMEEAGIAQMSDRTLLRQAFSRYLPDTLRSYLALPAVFSDTTRVDGGCTPKELLVSQLDLLKSNLNRVRENLLCEAAQPLLANHRFLLEKLADTPLEGRP